MSPRAIAVVLNWNGMDVLDACLSSLLASRGVDLRVLVVDNASTDGSVRFIKEKYPQAGLIELSENTGYCRGNNIGMGRAIDAGAEFVLLANNDIKVAPDAIAELIRAADGHPEAGAFGGKIYFMDRPDTLQSAGIVFKKEKLEGAHRGMNTKDEGQFDSVAEMDALIGCLLMFRTDALKKTGLLDERFHFYHEETDLCLRVGEAGYKALFVPASKTYHRSGFDLVERRLRNVYYLNRNILLLWKKHKPIPGFRAYRVVLRHVLEEYFIAKAEKYKSPHLYSIAGSIGMLHYFLGRFGPAPEILNSKLFSGVK